MPTLCSPSIEPYTSRETSFQNQLSWLVKLATTPGWKEYAWSRTIELDKQDLFRGIKNELVKQMQNENTKQRKT